VRENDRSESDRRAIDACTQVRNDAVRLLGNINSGGDTYFDRQVAEDVDVTSRQAQFFQSVIDRMNIAITALEAHYA
jgi:hypothetical protein